LSGLGTRDAGAGQGRVEGRGELPGTVAEEELEIRSAAAEVQQQIATCWVVHGPSGFAVTPRIWT
jgi:hypothetical protein